MFNWRNWKLSRLLVTLRDQQDLILNEVARLKQLEKKIDLFTEQLKLNNIEILKLNNGLHENLVGSPSEIQNQIQIHHLKNRSHVRQSVKEIHSELLEKNNSNYMPASPKNFTAYLDDLRQLNPRVFPLWRELFENGKRSYLELRDASCSMDDNIYVQAFHAFISLYSCGHILDIGSGIYGLPAYLKGYPKELISGIEPLDLVEPADFEVVQGFAEFMPWNNNSFATVLSGTSLDHVLCLDTALKEIHRVMCPNGRFLVWLGAVHGAKPFDPHAEPLKAIDDFHLFHFDAPWFEETIHPLFSIQEKIVFPTVSFDHVFYCLNPRHK